MALLEREILEGSPIDGDEVVQFGSGTETVWRTGRVVSIEKNQARVQFDIDSAGIPYSGVPALLVPLVELKKIA